MSGPKISATEMKRLHLFEEERRRLLQDLVRLKEELKQRGKDISNLSVMMLPFYSDEEAKEHAKVLGNLEKSVNESLPRIEAALLDGTNLHMKEVLTQLLSKHDKDEEMLRGKEERIYELREKWLGAATVSAKESKTPGFSMEAAAGECNRILALLDDLIARSEECRLESGELKKLKSEITELKEDTGRDGFSLFSEIHHLDLMKIRPIRERIEKEERRLNKLDERLSAELARYHMLCRAADAEPEKFALEEASVERIRYACGELLSKIKAGSDIRLLMKTVRESLEEYGYTYLGEREEDIEFTRELYQINTDTVLHVIYDSMGRITMEVAAFDTKDREPHPREVERLVKEQEKFCADYEKIFHLINEHGLSMRKEAMYPPSPDFAQVINTSGFDCPKQAAGNLSDEMYLDRKTKYLQMPVN